LGGLVGGRLIREAISNAEDAGIVVVAATGNSGPSQSTISYPAAAREAIAVGATRNNVSQSLAVELSLEPKVVRSDVLAMRETHILDEVSGPLVFVNFAREEDVVGLDLEGAIAIAVRGGETGELVYFADKEVTVAKLGAKALIVYNNLPGPFIGTLLHPARPGYSSTIPVVSMPRDQGEAIATALLDGRITATLRFLPNPDSVDSYSSRGPSSPFFIKPDIVAPGSFINSTWVDGGTRVLSGTSFAAPFVTGSAALLKQLHPELDPESIASILKLSSTVIRTREGEIVTIFDQGSGRLNISSAIRTPIVVKPHNLVIHLSPTEKESTKMLTLSSLATEPLTFEISTATDSDGLGLIALNRTVGVFPNASSEIGLRATVSGSEFGSHQGFVYLEAGLLKLSLPVIVYFNNATIVAERADDVYAISMNTLGEIHSGRVVILNPDNRNSRLDVSQGESILEFRPSKVGTYYVNAELRTSEGLELGRTVFDVKSTKELSLPMVVPMRAILIIAVWLILGAILAVTLFIFKKEDLDLGLVKS
ncbi:MAG: S8 family serine peptidase, partial [Nitrososphaerales archaeon]